MSRLLCLAELLRRIARSPHSLQGRRDVEDDLKLGGIAACVQRVADPLQRDVPGRDLQVGAADPGSTSIAAFSAALHSPTPLFTLPSVFYQALTRPGLVRAVHRALCVGSTHRIDVARNRRGTSCPLYAHNAPH